MRIEKRKLLGSIIGVAMFIITLLALSYAYYTWKSDDTLLSFNIDDSYFYCDSGVETNVQGLSPISDADYRLGAYQTFTVSNIGKQDTTFSLTMNILSIDELLVSESVKYKLMVDQTGGSNNCADINNKNCVSVGEGNFKNAKVGMNTLVESISLPNNVRYTYYLFFYVDNTVENSTNIMESSMTSVLEVCEVVVFLDYDGGSGTSEFLKVNGTYEGLPTTATREKTVITYNGNGGSNPTSGTITYEFDGWYTEIDGGGSKVTSSTKVTSTTNHTLYANWVNDKAVELPETTRIGYTFAGWYSDSALTNKIGDAKDSYKPESSVTLYAKWIPNTAKVTIKRNGSDWSSSGINVALYSETTSKYAYSTGTASGATVSWSAVAEGTYNVYASKSSSALTTLVDTGVDIVVSSTGSATINYYVLTLNKGTGISSVGGASTYLKDQTASISATASTGYTFSGWTVNSGNTPTSNTAVTITQATTLTATATANPLTFNDQTLTAGTYNTSYSQTFTGASNGTGTYTYEVTGVTLNGAALTASSGKYNGLALSTKTITGTPTQAGTYKFTILATDSGSGVTEDAVITVVINKKTVTAPTSLTISTAGIVTFSGATNATGYQISIDNSNWSTITNGGDYLSTIIASTGSRTVYVRAVNSDTTNYSTPSGNKTASVTVYKVTIQSNSTTKGTVSLSSYNVISGATYVTSGATLTFKGITTGTTTKNLTTVTASAKTGYSLSSWSPSSGTITSAATVTANFAGNEYTVTFNPNGGSVSTTSKTVTYGSAYGTLPNATRKGYSSTGWFTAASGGSQVTASTTVSTASNHTLYSQWSAKQYTVQYSCGSGSGTAPANQTITTGATITIAANTCTAPKGYEFSKWSDPTGDTSWTNWTGKWSYDNDEYGIEDNVLVLTAQYTPRTFTVQYSCGSGSGTPPTSQTVKYGSTITIAANTCTPPKGHEFSKWYDGDGKDTGWTGWTGTWSYDNGQYGITNDTLTLTAHYEPKTYTVNYSCGSGSGTPPTSQTVEYGSTITIASATDGSCALSGYTLSKWADPTGVTSWTGWTGTWSYVDGDYGIENDILTLTAQYTTNTATITIRKDGSAWSSSGMNVALYSGTTSKYAYSTSTKSGSTVSWTSVAAGTYNVYAGKNSGSKTSLVDTGVDVTVTSSGTATIDYYTLTVNNGNTTAISAVSGGAIYLKNQKASISATVNSGYTFSGWTKNSGNTPASTTAASTTVTLTQATTLTANATANIYSVTLDNQSATTAGTTKVYYQYNTTKTVNGVLCYYYTDSALTTCLTDGYTIVKPTKTGYSFYGYFTSTSGSGTQYVNASGGFINNVYKTIGDKTLYAYWYDDIAPTVPTYSAVYDDGSGTYTSEKWATKQVNTVLTATDAGDGVSYFQYQKNGGSWTKLSLGESGGLSTSGITGTGTEGWSVTDGRNDTIYFRACDKNNNCSGSSAKYVIRYDTTAPTVPTYTASFADGSGTYTSGKWAASQVNTTLSSTDASSGVAYMQYKESTASSWSTFGFNVTALTQNGTTWTGTESWGVTNGRNQSYYFRACDNAVPSPNCSVATTDPQYTIKYDTSAPTVSDIGGGTTLKATSQSLTLKCTDNIGVTAYYWGTTEPTAASSIKTTTAADLTSLTGSSGLSKTVSSAGTYWLACRDEAGNFAKKSIVIRKYVVNNLLETIAGTTGTYTSANYTSASTGTYYIKNGTTLTLTSIYTKPTGAGTFKGYSTSYSTTAVTPSTTNPTVATNNTTTYYMWWNRNTYNVTVSKPTNGTVKAETVTKTGNSVTASTSAATLTVKYGDTVKATATAATDTAQYNYSFSSWSGGYLSGTTNPATGGTVTAAKTITANFSSAIIDYKVTINHSGCSSVSPTSATVPYGTTYSVSGTTISFSNGSSSTVTVPTDTAQYDYSLSSWSSTSGTITAAKTITATCTSSIKSYKVTIKSNNTSYGTVSPTSATVSYGTTYSAGRTANGGTLTFSDSKTSKATPTTDTAQYDYSLSSWSSTSGTITGAATITANFTRSGKTYTLTYNVNCTGGSVSPASKTVTYGSTYGTLPTPSCTGYTFLGWFDTTASKYDSTKTYKDHPLLYYADTQGDLYTAFGYNESSLRSHYFNNGISEGRRTTQFASTDTVTITANKTLYAGWVPNTYTITFDDNGGTGGPGSQNFIYNNGDKISTTEPTRFGYEFSHWQFNSLTFAPGDTIPNNMGSFTLTAQWNKTDAAPTITRGSVSWHYGSPGSISVTYSLSDDNGITGYYWGTSSSASSYTSHTSTSLTVSATSSGTYNLIVKDTAGNTTTATFKWAYYWDSASGISVSGWNYANLGQNNWNNYTVYGDGSTQLAYFTGNSNSGTLNVSAYSKLTWNVTVVNGDTAGTSLRYAVWN